VRSRPGLDRAAVVEAAAALADESGLDALTLAALAARLGVQTPSLYNHVAGLDGLRRDLALLGTRLLGVVLGRAVRGRASDDAVMALASAYRAFVAAHPGLYEATIRLSWAGGAPDPEMQAAGAEVVEIAQVVLAAYGLHGEASIHAVRALRSAMHGFATLEAAGGFGLPQDVDESFRRLIAMIIAGLHQQAAAADNRVAHGEEC
jgi:AcrR family transcriptional regulator